MTSSYLFPSAAATRNIPVSRLRPEIQALRALAVFGVLIFHLWPARLTGGYAGVDVFFVISGFLITGHIFREIERTGGLKLSRFWARRIRRLLPASLLVIVFSLIGTIVWVPQARWPAFLSEIVASSLYVQNWLLANNSVDYLAAENTASPVQHYWSLSLEEQFYVLFPLLLLLALFIARRDRERSAAAILTVLGFVGVASFAYSVWYSYTAPAPAYFVTTTRIWEFAAGGVLAILTERGKTRAGGWSWLLSLAGWVLVAASYLVLTSSTVFPGYAALLPVIGSVLVILGGSGSSPLLDGVVSWRPIRYLGDISYSIYLWHWPLIIFASYVFGELHWPYKIVIVAITIALAALTKRYVEDPVRSAAWLTQAGFARTASVILVPALVVSAIGIAGNTLISNALRDSEQQLEQQLADPANCLGARSLYSSDCADVVPTGLIPAIAGLADDTSGAFSCYTYEASDPLQSCTFGSALPEATHIALVGDSHGAMLIPALREIAEERNWSIDTYVGRGCPWVDSTDIDTTDSCSTRQNELNSRLLDGDYDQVIVTYRSLDNNADQKAHDVAQRYANAWEQLATDTGSHIIALTDNPRLTDADFDCLTGTPAADLIAGFCNIPESTALGYPDAVKTAAEIAPDVSTLADTRNLFCLDGYCPVTIGGVIVYRDTHHITASYSKTMAPYLADILSSAMATTAR